MLIAEVEARMGERRERYVLPLGGAPEDAPGPLIQQLALSRLRRGREVGYLTDGFALDGLARATVSALRQSLRLPSPDGEIQFLPSSLMSDLDLPADAEIRRLSALSRKSSGC